MSLVSTPTGSKYFNSARKSSKKKKRNWNSRFHITDRLETGVIGKQKDGFKNENSSKKKRRRSESSFRIQSPSIHISYKDIGERRKSEQIGGDLRFPVASSRISNSLREGSSMLLFVKLKDRLIKLWNDLHVPEKERLFYTVNHFHYPSDENIAALTEEIDRLVEQRDYLLKALRAVEKREQYLLKLNQLSSLYEQNGASNYFLLASQVNTLMENIQRSTTDVLHAINIWKSNLNVDTPFLWKNQDYIKKIRTDLEFFRVSKLSSIVSDLGITTQGSQATPKKSLKRLDGSFHVHKSDKKRTPSRNKSTPKTSKLTPISPVSHRRGFSAKSVRDRYKMYESNLASRPQQTPIQDFNHEAIDELEDIGFLPKSPFRKRLKPFGTQLQYLLQQEEAVLRIQLAWRRYKALQHYVSKWRSRQKENAAITIQLFFRKVKARNEYLKRKRNWASLCISLAFKRYLARKKYDQRYQEKYGDRPSDPVREKGYQNAVIISESTFQRDKVESNARLSAISNNLGFTDDRITCLIQRQIRGKLSSSLHHEAISDVMLVQSAVRSTLARKNLQEMDVYKSCICIQSILRRRKAFQDTVMLLTRKHIQEKKFDTLLKNDFLLNNSLESTKSSQSVIVSPQQVTKPVTKPSPDSSTQGSQHSKSEISPKPSPWKAKQNSVDHPKEVKLPKKSSEKANSTELNREKATKKTSSKIDKRLKKTPQTKDPNATSSVKPKKKSTPVKKSSHSAAQVEAQKDTVVNLKSPPTIPKLPIHSESNLPIQSESRDKLPSPPSSTRRDLEHSLISTEPVKLSNDNQSITLDSMSSEMVNSCGSDESSLILYIQSIIRHVLDYNASRKLIRQEKKRQIVVFTQNSLRRFITHLEVAKLLSKSNQSEESQAANIIQGTARTYLARLLIEKIRNEKKHERAIVWTQSLVRLYFAQRDLLRLREEVFKERMLNARKALNSMLIRRLAREHLYEKFPDYQLMLSEVADHCKMERAALKIQCLARQWLAKRSLKPYIDSKVALNRAATMISSFWKMYRCRRYVFPRLQEQARKEREYQLRLEEAAFLVSRVARVQIAKFEIKKESKKKANRFINSVLRIQAWKRGMDERKLVSEYRDRKLNEYLYFLHREKACNVIQRYYRRFLKERERKKERRDIELKIALPILQRTARKFLACKQVRMLKDAQELELQKLIKHEKAAAILTSQFRVWRAKLLLRRFKLHKKYLRAVNIINPVARAYLAKKKVKKLKEQTDASKVIQAYVRSKLVRQVMSDAAATQIQNSARKFIGQKLRKKFQVELRMKTVSAIKIQSVWRSYYDCKYGPTILPIQSIVRKKLAAKDMRERSREIISQYADLLIGEEDESVLAGAAIKIQTCCRQFLARKRVNSLRVAKVTNAAITIQSGMRKFIAIKRVCLLSGFRELKKRQRLRDEHFVLWTQSWIRMVLTSRNHSKQLEDISELY